MAEGGIKVPRQASDNLMETSESFSVSAETAVLFTCTSNVISSIIFSELLEFLWQIVNTLQIIMSTALFSVIFPINAQVTMFSVLQLSNFDLTGLVKIVMNKMFDDF